MLHGIPISGGRRPPTTDVADAWRLIEHGPVDGALNMAIDRAVQLSREKGASPPTLRLYRWSRPTATLGRFQDVASVDMHYAASHGIDVVRRSTGGRGVLHDAELTYSVVAGVEDGIPRGVAASYRLLCGALVASYASLGVDASLTARDKGVRSASCYLQTTRADLSVGRLKLSGSAQVWAGDTVLQHGSFVIARDTEREARVFRLEPGQTEQLAGAACSLTDVLATAPDLGRVSAAAVEGFESALGITLVPGSLTVEEALVAGSLLPEFHIAGTDGIN